MLVLVNYVSLNLAYHYLHFVLVTMCLHVTGGYESNRKAMNMNWSNQKPNPALKTKLEINKKYK